MYPSVRLVVKLKVVQLGVWTLGHFWEVGIILGGYLLSLRKNGTVKNVKYLK